jgi:hypothetical protein
MVLECQTDRKRTSPHHMIVKILSKQSKERMLKAARENDQVKYK